MTDADKVMHPQHFGTDPTIGVRRHWIRQTYGSRSGLIRKSGFKPGLLLVQILALVEVCAL